MTTKVGIVTGGGQGIGKAIARSLLQEGYKVGILDIDETTGKETAEKYSSEFGSGSCIFLKCDVTETEQLKGSYEQVKELLGNVTVVVNNAGIAQEVNWTKSVDINLKAVIDMTYLAVDKMRKDKGGTGGTIVNVASVAGLGSFPGFPVYAATKWGVVGFTRSMAASLALAEEDWGIHLQALCPLYTDTQLIRQAGMDGKRNTVVSPATPGEECEKYVRNRVQQHYVMSPSDIGKAFTKLLKDNKRDAVLMVRPGEDSTVRETYVQQKWSEI